MKGTELKEWRQRHGVTQEEFAREVGVSWSTVAKWEGGQRQPGRLTQPLIERAIRRLEKQAGKGRAA